MTIAILAHDSRKELALQFCTAYSGILSRNTVIATGTTGRTGCGVGIGQLLQPVEGMAAGVALESVDRHGAGSSEAENRPRF